MKEAEMTRRGPAGAAKEAFMKAAQIAEYGHSDVVKVNEVEVPRPNEQQVLVQVHASSINPYDWKVREGLTRSYITPSFPATLGMDLSGVIHELGPGATAFKPGDRVYGQSTSFGGGSGAFAEYATAPAGAIGLMPTNVTFEEAAALPLTGVSAVQGITEHIRLRKGQKILIHGASGGIGSVAVQIAKFIGAYVAATASGRGIEYVRSLGADEVIDYKAAKFEDVLGGYDAVFDTVGGENPTRSLKVLKKGGVIACMLDQPDPELAAAAGVTSIGQLTKVTTARLDALRKLVEAGIVTVHVDETFPLDRIRDAFDAKEKGKVVGKLVIQIRE